METVLYLPLTLSDRVVGVFSVQSPKKNAYSESQLNLLRTLSSTVAIAVVNADTFTRLQEAQSKLIQKEKMASLGALVAGIAHEINTPLGICVTATSLLQAEHEKIFSQFRAEKIQKADFDKYLHQMSEGLSILETNTERAAKLIQSFKQLSVDQSSHELRKVNFKTAIDNVILSLKPLINQLNPHVRFVIKCKPELSAKIDAGAFAQIFTNLIINSLAHAFTHTSAPEITIEIKIQANRIQIDYKDNGCGMSEAELEKLFEPFYTTKRNQGGTGLGAHIAFNIVTGVFNGSIEAMSEANQGLAYRIEFPAEN